MDTVSTGKRAATPVELMCHLKGHTRDYTVSLFLCTDETSFHSGTDVNFLRLQEIFYRSQLPAVCHCSFLCYCHKESIKRFLPTVWAQVHVDHELTGKFIKSLNILEFIFCETEVPNLFSDRLSHSSTC